MFGKINSNFMNIPWPRHHIRSTSEFATYSMFRKDCCYPIFEAIFMVYNTKHNHLLQNLKSSFISVIGGRGTRECNLASLDCCAIKFDD